MTRETSVLLVGVLIIVASVASAGVVMAMDDSGASTPATDASAEANRTITVGASGEAAASPGTATVRLSIEAADANIPRARTAVAENVSAVRDALGALGIDEEKIRTTGYNIYEDRRDDRSSEVEETVYRASHTLAIEVNDTEMVGRVIDAAVSAGATSVRGVQFGLTESARAELKQDALAAAMANARTQAESIAATESMTVESVVHVRTTDVRSPSPVYVTETVDMAAGAGTDIRSGPVTVTATVQVTYEAAVQG